MGLALRGRLCLPLRRLAHLLRLRRGQVLLRCGLHLALRCLAHLRLRRCLVLLRRGLNLALRGLAHLRLRRGLVLLRCGLHLALRRLADLRWCLGLALRCHLRLELALGGVGRVAGKLFGC